MALANRLKKNLKHFQKWARRQNIGAFRLYDRDIPEYPYTVDIYNDKAVVGLRLQKIDEEPEKKVHLTELYLALEELGFNENKRFVKKRRVQDKNQGDLYQKEATSAHEEIIQEGPLFFITNLTDYLDTGLFLDHRPLRSQLVQKNLQGKKVLNLFSYTCSLSVAAAKAGAVVTSNDLNPHYLTWGKKNFEKNDLNPNEHRFIEGDCLEFIKNIEDHSFDLVIVDPPTFSVSKKFKGTWDIQRDHYFLLKECWRVIKSGGELYFSCNLRSFKLDSGVDYLKPTSHQTIPQDFHDKKIHHSFYGKK